MKVDKITKIIIGVMIFIFLIYFTFMIFLISQVGKQIDKNGGFGKSIGKFVHDVNSEANKK